MSNINSGWRELHTRKRFLSRRAVLSHASIVGKDKRTDIFCIHPVGADPELCGEYYEVRKTTTIAYILQAIFTAVSGNGEKVLLDRLLTVDEDGEIRDTDTEMPRWTLPYVARVLFARLAEWMSIALSQKDAELRSVRERATELKHKLSLEQDTRVKLQADLTVADDATKSSRTELSATLGEKERLEREVERLTSELATSTTELRELKIRLTSLAEPSKARRVKAKARQVKETSQDTETQEAQETQETAVQDEGPLELSSLLKSFQKFPEHLKEILGPVAEELSRVSRRGASRLKSNWKNVPRPRLKSMRASSMWKEFDKNMNSFWGKVEDTFGSIFGDEPKSKKKD